MIQQYLSIFIVFAIIGWFLEVGHKLILMRKFINTGYLFGPYLPIYGFGGLILYLINNSLNNFYLVVGITWISLIILELGVGLFFKDLLKIKVWDYSNDRFNFKGAIDLEHSIYWLILITIFTKTVYPYLPFTFNNYFLIVAYSILLIDLLHSIITKRKPNLSNL